MQVEIPCERCRVALRVPPEAAGHRARCPACGYTFQVPKVDDLLEETVSGWIEEDLEHLIEDRDRESDERVLATPQPVATGVDGRGGGVGTDGSATGDGRAEPPRQHARRPSPRDGNGRSHVRPPSRHLWPVRDPSQPAVPGGAAIPAREGGIDSGDPDIEIITEPVTPSRPAPPIEPAAAAATAAAPESDERGDGPGRYPRNLHVDERVPHLVVQKVDAAGVHFAFDSQWLKHDGFRASMPVRCAFSGTRTQEKLIARPLVFIDRLLGSASQSLDQIVNAHENRTVVDHSSREIARVMGMIESMPRPFAYAMPYYVAAKYSHLSLHCRTRDRVSGGITCEVIMPDPACALDWLARVNGVCGEEYHLLEQDVSLLHGDAWQELSEEARQRIEVWCKFQPREVMRHFFSDADFGRLDVGLAGLIVTDQRLVYCKYHHKGQVSLDAEQATVIARPDGRFVGLTLRVGADTHRMIKIHQSDLTRLDEALKAHGSIALQVSG